MEFTTSPRHNFVFGLVVSLAIAGVLLFPGLGSFGFFEPHETDRADLAVRLSSKAGSGVDDGTPLRVGIEERLVGTAFRLFGTTRAEWVARVPLALFGLIVAAVLFGLVSALATVRIATFATVALVCSPLFIFHARQITSGLPILFSEILALGGLALLAGSNSRARTIAAAGAALVGLFFGGWELGLLIGVAAPCATASIALLMSKPSDFKSTSAYASSNRRSQVAILTGLLAVAGAATYFTIVLLPQTNLPILTGGTLTSAASKNSFDRPLELLAYGWFPFSAMAPAVFFGVFVNRKPGTSRVPMLLRNLTFAGFGVGYLAVVLDTHFTGPGPIFLAIPMTLATAIVVEDLYQNHLFGVLFSLLGCLLLAILVRDFAKSPPTLLTGYAWTHIPIPKDFTYETTGAAFLAPTLLFVLMFAVLGTDTPNLARWRKRLTLPFMIAGGIVFAAYLSAGIVPQLATHLSSKYALESYEQFKTGDEPLGLFGPSKFVSKGKALHTEKEVVTWLDVPHRVFALFPPKNFAPINRMIRERTGRNLFILDATSDRFYLATSNAAPGETNENPIAGSIQASPFSDGPGTPLKVNLNDMISLLGYHIQGSRGGADLIPGKYATFTTFWQCTGKTDKNYKIFLHVDGPGGRMHGDHEPLDDTYPTRQWLPGDYIRDVYRLKIPRYQKSGTYRVWLGMYRGSRLPVKDFTKARENAIPLGKVEVR